MNFFGWPSLMKAVGITTWFQFTQAQCLFCQQGQKEWQNSLRLFCRWFGHYFALFGKIDTTSLTRECSCMLCPNVENFCPNYGQFLSFGDAIASPASPCCTLMVSVTKIPQQKMTEMSHRRKNSFIQVLCPQDISLKIALRLTDHRKCCFIASAATEYTSS